jgi:hypothetical protein
MHSKIFFYYILMDKFNILGNGNISVSHFKNRDDILVFLEKNPMWLSGFVCGEGCFTGYLSLDIKSLWGLQPGLDFNITQSTNDKILLEAINLYFDNKGGVYSKPNNVSVVAFRNVKVLREVIVPFFYKYPLVGIKSYELERWIKLIDIYYNKKHVGIDISTKNYILEFAKICKELNIRRVNKNKLERINIIIDWLKNLDSFPSKDEKLNLIKLIKTRSIQI